MNQSTKKYLILLTVIFYTVNLFSQEPDRQIKKVHLIFKTHLDIGFTKLSSEVERQYVEEFIPNTLNIIEQLRAENAEERYVWTTGVRRTVLSVRKPVVSSMLKFCSTTL